MTSFLLYVAFMMLMFNCSDTYSLKFSFQISTVPLLTSFLPCVACMLYISFKVSLWLVEYLKCCSVNQELSFGINESSGLSFGFITILSAEWLPLPTFLKSLFSLQCVFKFLVWDSPRSWELNGSNLCGFSRSVKFFLPRLFYCLFYCYDTHVYLMWHLHLFVMTLTH